MTTRQGMLVILDGWGHREDPRHNAIAAANTPAFSRLHQTCPSTLLTASSIDVGLPRGLMGNSEVGHLNLGAGRVVWQEVTRINHSIEEGDFFKNHAFLDAMGKVRAAGGRLHLMGLLSDGGVHSYEFHYLSLLELAKQQGLPADRVIVHAITDGRDTPPVSGIGFIERLEAKMAELEIGRVGSVVGRYYAMDRDKRWERLEKAYRAYTEGTGTHTASWREAVEANYMKGETDEFCNPILVTENGKPFGLVRDGDSVIFFNYRADRGREISHAFTDHRFPHFERTVAPRVHWVCMTQYDPRIPAPVAFPPQRLDNVFGEHLAEIGLTQYRIAETEKYAHVTYFFNGGREEPFQGEERDLVPSPKVATYDLLPEMNASEVTSRLLKRLDKGLPDFLLVNYANPDMVGHTGVMDAAVRAVEHVDGHLGRVVEAFTSRGGVALVTADHGNAELMFDEELEEPHTAHTTSPVPLIAVAGGLPKTALADGGRLCDVVPTLGALMGIDLPEEMEGRSLLRS